MKTPYVVALVLVAVLVTVAIEEGRMSSLKEGREAVSPENKGQAALVARPAEDGDGAPAPRVTKRERPEPAEAPAPVEDETDEESLGKTVRKMWDNPAGRSMMNQGVKIAVAMMYEDFIEDLDLDKEESKYFKELLGQEMSAQQELGMKMMSATPDEREELVAELEKRGKAQEEDVKKFLNSDEDFAAYTAYKQRLPERQQMDGIRANMSAKGAEMDEETETKLVDAMYRVRTETDAPDFSGPDAMKEMAKGNISETYEKTWDKQQEALVKETAGFLSPEQQEALAEQQKQMKEMQMMGLKMAEKMMSKDAAEDTPEVEAAE